MQAPQLMHLLIALIQFAATWPVWTWYIARVRDGSDEPWCLVALATAGLLVGWEQPKTGQPTIRTATALIAFYTVALFTLPPIFRAAAAFLAIGLTLADWRGIRGPRWGFCLLLLLSTPLLASLDFYCAYPLRVLVAESSSRLLGLAGFTVHPEGTLLRWGDQIVEVDAPCSGVRMLFAGIYLAATLAALYRFSLGRTVLALGTALAAVVFGNVLRATALFFPESGVLALPPWAHPAVGLLVFASIAALMFIAANFLKEEHA
jgi:exosortase